jgi:hypothetical protein
MMNESNSSSLYKRFSNEYQNSNTKNILQNELIPDKIIIEDKEVYWHNSNDIKHE